MAAGEVLVHEGRVNLASRLVYEPRISEVPLQVSVVGIQQPRTAYLGQRQHMWVI